MDLLSRAQISTDALHSIAAAFSASPEAPDEIEVIQTWPGGSNLTTEKCPSEITYTDSGQPRWGYQVQGEGDRLRCMKIMLDSRQELLNYVSQSDLKNQLLRKGKDARAVVTDYLRELWEHAKTTISRR